MLSFVGCGVLQYIDNVVDVLGTRLLYGGLWKNFTYFLRARAVCLEPGPCFLKLLVPAATCPCALRQSTEVFGRISSLFYVKSGLRAPRAVLTLVNLNIMSTSSVWQSPRASVNVAFGRISHIFIVTVDSDLPCAVRTWKSGHCFHLQSCTCSHMVVGGVLGGSDAFFALDSGLSRSRAPVFGALDGEEFFAIEGFRTGLC